MREKLEREAKIDADKTAQEEKKFGDPIENMKYIAVFYIPDAQFVIYDQINKKYYVQSSAHKESLYSPETIRADNDFTVSLYNISNDQIKPGLGTITPNEREELVHASK